MYSLKKKLTRLNLCTQIYIHRFNNQTKILIIDKHSARFNWLSIQRRAHEHIQYAYLMRMEIEQISDWVKCVSLYECALFILSARLSGTSI